MSSRPRALLRLGVLIGVVVGSALVVWLTPLGTVVSAGGVGEATRFLRGSTWAPVVFVVAYALLTAVAFPGAVLTLVGGAVFGFAWGVVYVTLGANLGANAAFLLARKLGRDGVRTLMGEDSGAIEKLDRVVDRHGFRGLLALRLIPLVPFNALNLASGLVSLSWTTYALATALGILPGTVVYVLFADAILEGSRQASTGALVRVGVAGALILLLTFLPGVLRRLGVPLPGGSQPGGRD